MGSTTDQVTAEQVQDYRRATGLLLTVAYFRTSRMSPEEHTALVTAARVLGELADSDEGRPGATR